MIAKNLSPEETVILSILETFGTAFSVSTTDTQRLRVLETAAKHAGPFLLAYAEARSKLAAS
jgi:hypothetical protein